jgi:hypothetical protein
MARADIHDTTADRIPVLSGDELPAPERKRDAVGS